MKKYDEQVTIAFLYFQLCGLCTFTLHRQSFVRSPHLFAWIVLHAGILTAISTVVAMYPGSVFFDSDPIGKLTDVIQLVFPFAAHFAGLAEACRTRTARQRLRWMLRSADQELQRRCDVPALNDHGMHRFGRKAIAMQGLCVSIEVRIMAAIGLNPQWLNLWLALLFTMVVNQSQHLLHIWHVDEVCWRLHACADVLQLDSDVAVDRGGSGGCKDSGPVPRRSLLAMRRCHANLWQAMRLTNESFGWTALTTVTANFVSLSVNLYWNFVAMYFGSNPYWKESLMGSLPMITCLWTLCWSCEQTELASKRIGYNLHGIRSTPGNRAEIREFSLQIRQLPFRISAHRFFDINMNLFGGIIAAIATYMLIFIQFMPYYDIFIIHLHLNTSTKQPLNLTE